MIELIKKRIAAYGIDLLPILGYYLVLIFSYLFQMVVFFMLVLVTNGAIIFMQKAYSNAVSIIIPILYILVVLLVSAIRRFCFTQTMGMNFMSLKVIKAGRLKQFLRWFLKTGFLHIVVPLYLTQKNYPDLVNAHMPLLQMIEIAAIYATVDGIVFLLTKGKKSLTDMLLKTEVEILVKDR